MDDLKLPGGCADESRAWSGGGAIVAYDLPEDSPQRAAFAADTMGESLANMKSLGARSVLAGKALPAKPLPSADDVKEAVAANK